MPPKPTQPLPSENDMRSEPKVVQIGRDRRTMAALVNSLTLSGSGSQRGSSLGNTVTTAARSDTVHDDHRTSSQHDAGGAIIVPQCITQSRDHDPQASTSELPPLPEIQLALAKDLTGQIFGTINDYVASGTFGNVYRCEWRQPSGTVKVAVKAFRNFTNRASEQDLRRFRREIAIWAHLVHDNIVTLHGTTEGFGPSTALVSQWFPDGTLFRLITERGTTLIIESKLKLLHGIASGLYYLHSSDVVHGDITSSNVMVDLKDGEYRACLTDLGLSNALCGHLNDRPIEGSTVRPGSARWTAPELLKPHETPSDIKPTTQNDMYSFGRVMFHLLTLVVPWCGIDEYKLAQKIQQGEVIPRPEIPEATSDVTDTRWNHIEQCWSINPSDRPSAFEAMGFLKREQEALKQDDVIVGGAQGSHQNAYTSLPILLPPAEDLTGQIFGTINPYVASGTLGNVYRCEWRRPSGTIKVAVKAFRNPTNRASEQDRRRFRRETAIWAHLIHDNIVTLFGTTEGFGPSTALVSQWFPDGTLFRLITERGTTLTIKSKLKLLHGIASGLYYLHAFPMVHGDITSANVMVDLKDGKYRACLTDLGLSNVICGHLNDRPIEVSTFWPGAVRWTAPELLKPHDPTLDFKLTTQNDMYSFGRVMFHLLTLVVPWYGIDEYKVVQKIKQGEVIPRPEISDVTDARWNHIEQCWSIHPSIRPSAFEAMGFLKREHEALKQDDAPVDPATPDHFSTVSSLSLAGPLNVLLFGETGVRESAIINLIGNDVAETSLDAEPCTLQHTPHGVNLGDRNFQFWEVSSIESMDFFRASFTKRLLKKSYKKLYEDDRVNLLLYCMRGSRDQRARIRDYKIFTDVVGSSVTVAGGVPVAAVVTGLEDYPEDMDGWWTKNKDNLESLGMRFTAHACITSLPDDPYASPTMRARRHQSKQAIRNLILNSYQAGAEKPRGSGPAPTV